MIPSNTFKLYCQSLIFLLATAVVGINSQNSDCGRLPSRGSEADVRTRVPWLTSVFIQKTRSGSFRFLLTGIIVGPSTVLTVLNGSYGSSPYRLFPPESIFVVGAPKSSLPVMDTHSAIRQVKYLEPYTGHGPDNPEYHYVLLHLREPFDLSSSHIRRICLPPLRVPKSFRDAAGGFYDTKVAGFFTPRSPDGSYPFEVRSLKVNTNKRECEGTYRGHYNGTAAHTFCGHLTGPSPGCSIYGNSVFVEFGTKAFLAGMTVLVPAFDQCSGKAVHFFTDLYDHLEWILNSLKCSPNGFPCRGGTCIPLAKVCDGVTNCRDGLDEHPGLCRSALQNCPPGRSHRCHLLGKCLKQAQLCNGVAECLNRSDEGPEVCKPKI